LTSGIFYDIFTKAVLFTIIGIIDIFVEEGIKNG